MILWIIRAATASVLHSFLWLSKTPLPGQTALCLSIPLLVGICIIPSFAVLGMTSVVLLSTSLCGRLYISLESIPRHEFGGVVW